MNIDIPDDAKVKWLFLDLNSFFASCEQQERPELRGRPIAVVQMDSDHTCAIAASYAAKAFGVKTGTMIGEAKQRCPGLVLVKARQQLYASYHHRIVEAVGTCLPVEKVCSIDEMGCRLMGSECAPEAARECAIKIKQTIRSKVGECMTCSVGLAPNMFLAKVASDMQKPDGLVTITKADLPHVLHRLALTDIYGIGERMEYRLRQCGIGTSEELMRAPRDLLRRAWGGVTGVLYHELLHGADLQFPSSTESSSMSHQHVLEPDLRTRTGALQFSQHLLAKAAERLRNQNYYTKHLGLAISWVGDHGKYWNEVGFHETQDSAFLLKRLMELWQSVPKLKPLKVGVVLFGLIPAERHQMDLFTDTKTTSKNRPIKRAELSGLLDELNKRYGRGTVGFGLHDPLVRKFTGHAAFQRVPDEWEF